MSTYKHVGGFHPLHASQSGRTLVDGKEQCQVGVRSFRHNRIDFRLITMWQRFGWTHMVVNQFNEVIAQSFGKAERDSFAQVCEMLIAKEITLDGQLAPGTAAA